MKLCSCYEGAIFASSVTTFQKKKKRNPACAVNNKKKKSIQSDYAAFVICVLLFLCQQ